MQQRVKWRDVRQGRNVGRAAEEAVGRATQAKCRTCAGGGGLKENEGEGPF